MSPPSILQTYLLNTQKQDKGEMEPDSCQSIETGSKMAPSSQIPDIHSNHFTLLNISQYLPFTDGLPVPHKDKKVGGEDRRRHGRNITNSLMLLVWSQTFHHTKWDTFSHHPKIKPYLKKSRSPKDHHSDLEHWTDKQTHRTYWAKLPLASFHVSFPHLLSKVS